MIGSSPGVGVTFNFSFTLSPCVGPSDGRGIGVMDMVFWAHFMLKTTSYKSKLGATPKLWLESNPDMEIEAVDMTNPNPTGAEPTEGN